MSAQKVGKKQAKTGDKTKKRLRPLEIPKIAPHLKEESVVIPEGTMRICVVGCGAVGSVIAAYLRRAMRRVFVVDLPERVRAIRNHGLKIEGVNGTVYLTMDARERIDEACDLIILAVKTPDIKEVLDKNRDSLKKVPVVMVQHGVHADKIIAMALEPEFVLVSIVLFAAEQLDSGVIHHHTDGKWIMGWRDCGIDSRLKTIVDELSPAFAIEASDDINAMKWLQLLLQVIESVPALTGTSLQETFAHIDMSRLAILLLKESLVVLSEAKITPMAWSTFNQDAFMQLIHQPLDDAAKAFSRHMQTLSSAPIDGALLSHLKRNQPSEVDAINGEFVRMSRFASTGAELNSRVLYAIHQIEESKAFLSPEKIKEQFRLSDYYKRIYPISRTMIKEVPRHESEPNEQKTDSPDTSVTAD